MYKKKNNFFNLKKNKMRQEKIKKFAIVIGRIRGGSRSSLL